MKLDLCILAGTSASLVAADNIEDLRTGTTATASLDSVITPPPAFHAELFKRALATCGYIRGNIASPLTCANGYSCVTTAHALPAFACCNNIDCVQDWGICQDYGADDACYGLRPEICSSIYNSVYGSVLKCSSEAPHCYRYARSSARGAYLTYYSFACGTATSDILVLATATNDNHIPSSEPTSAARNPYNSIPGYTYAPYGSAPAIVSSASTKSKLSTRSIVLIVLFGGGVLFVALVLGFCFIQQRRKQSKNEQNSAYVSQPLPTCQPIVASGLGQVPVYQRNDNSHIRPPLDATRSNLSEITPTVHEVPAPVRPLHEMPGGYGAPVGRVG